MQSHPHRISFQLKSPTIEKITVNGSEVPLNDPERPNPPATATVYEATEWPYDEQAAPGQVAHLMGRTVTIAFPSTPPAEGATFDVIATYRGWALGDTTDSAEVARRYRFTAQDPARCNPQVSVASSVLIGTSTAVTWSAPGCKQAALSRTTGGVTVGGGTGAQQPPLGNPVGGALAECVRHRWRSRQPRRIGQFLDHQRQGQLPTTVPPEQSYPYCATGPNGNVQMYISATSEADAKQQAESNYNGAEWTVKSGYCSAAPLGPTTAPPSSARPSSTTNPPSPTTT